MKRLQYLQHPTRILQHKQQHKTNQSSVITGSFNDARTMARWSSTPLSSNQQAHA